MKSNSNQIRIDPHFFFLCSKWTRHQAFQSEIACNKERLDQVENSGAELLKTKAEMSNIIQEKLSQLSSEFDKLQTDTQEKGEKLFDAKRADLYEQSCDDIDCFVKVFLMFCFLKSKD